jgi:tRNA threonylcarbamoyladenosine biosynthesis protein TsaE
MRNVTCETASEVDTERLGGALARSLPETLTIALEGTLGAGKTRLVQAVAGGLEIDPATVTSPTFVLCQHHFGRRTLYHLDAYRMKDLDEFLELGVEEYFAGPGITLIEWAERVADCLPEDHLDVCIEITGPDSRRFDLHATGPVAAAVLEQLVQELA